MRERRASRTASIPSKHRGRRVGTEVHGSLMVRKLEGVVSPDNNNVTSVLDGVVLPNGDAMSNMNASRLKADLKNKLSSSEHDQRSLEFLIRLLKTGSFVRDVTNNENRHPDESSASARSLQNAEVASRGDDVSEPIDYALTTKSSRNSSPLSRLRPRTSDSSARFRRSIEELKSARERFGVCMSVNGTIAKARNVQQQNQMNRKAGRDKLPVISGSSSSESSDSERMPTPRKHGIIAPLGPWLALSGRRIQLKHQGHVERVLDQPERVLGRTEHENESRDFRKRNSRSAPPRGSVKPLPIRRFAWGDGNRFVIQKVNKTFQSTKTFLDFSASYHGYQSPSLVGEERPAAEGAADKSAPETSFEKTRKESQNSVVEATEEPTKLQKSPTSPSSFCTSNESSRPSSSSMPRPVRSVVIKLPTTDIVTSLNSSLPNMNSSSTAYQRTTPSLPPRPYVKFDTMKKTI